MDDFMERSLNGSCAQHLHEMRICQSLSSCVEVNHSLGQMATCRASWGLRHYAKCQVQDFEDVLTCLESLNDLIGLCGFFGRAPVSGGRAV